MVTDYSTPLPLGAACPVAACRVIRPGNNSSVALSACEHVVHVGCIGSTLHRHASLIECCLLVDLVLIAVKIHDIGGNLHSLGVEPGAIANAVFGVCPSASLCGKICVPSLARGTSGLGEGLAVSVSALQTPEIATFFQTYAGDEEAHRRLLGEHRAGNQQQCASGT